MNPPTGRSGNGRVVIDDEVSRGKFAFYEGGDSSLAFNKQALHSIHVETPLNQAFFSQDNEDWIQNALRRRVYDKSGGQYVIGKQDRTQLQIVMRSIFLQHGKNLDKDIDKQILHLNERVLEYCVRTVYSNVLQYIRYKQDVSRAPQVLAHPVKVSQAGSKTLTGFHMI